MGAVLAPTDPAILIPLFVRSRLRPKVAQTVVAESAFNDPTGAALALTLAGVLLSGDGSLWPHPVEDFLVDLAISTVIGVVAGVGLAAAISSHRSGVWRESSALAVLTVVTISFFSLDSAGGSGYLGAFLAGLIVGNMEHLGLAMHAEHEQEMSQFAFNLADLVTLLVFVVLGANIPFGELGDNLLPALAVLATLLLVARPLTVLACALPDRAAGWTRQELRSCAGRARPGWCRRRWWGCSPGWACRTATSTRAWWRWRSSERCCCRRCRRRGWPGGWGCSSRGRVEVGRWSRGARPPADRLRAARGDELEADRQRRGERRASRPTANPRRPPAEPWAQ